MNPRTRSEERVSRLFRTDGAQTVEIPAAGPGDVRGAAQAQGRPHRRHPLRPGRAHPAARLPPAQPAGGLRHPGQGGADDKAAAAIHKLIEEDPSLELASATPTPASSCSRRSDRPTSRSPSSG